ncbi:unnamed protein product [Acanthoscelides obtectus]|uniref:Uncharacterized protein n=1 Tax=Acanthoscelides obtectus TaxID=200917 RepID=A0A9P0K6A0_ACAOB|nr:unnamed protein product [Acanthoscelides obtectus]CAK1671996.1 hypothetical protein AOBTE_LOCUS28597 [Acanthoscelides obtectus]
MSLSIHRKKSFLFSSTVCATGHNNHHTVWSVMTTNNDPPNGGSTDRDISPIGGGSNNGVDNRQGVILNTSIATDTMPVSQNSALLPKNDNTTSNKRTYDNLTATNLTSTDDDSISETEFLPLRQKKKRNLTDQFTPLPYKVTTKPTTLLYLLPQFNQPHKLTLQLLCLHHPVLLPVRHQGSRAKRELHRLSCGTLRGGGY